MFNFKDLTPEQKFTFIEHLEDLRRALLISIVAIIVASIPAFYYSNAILAIVRKPLDVIHTSLNFTGVFTPFYVKLTLSLIAAVIVAFPIIAWQIWRFIAPGLYPQERKYVFVLFPAIIILFAAGTLFGYFIIMPAALYFLVVTMGSGLHAIITVDDYVSKLMAFTIPFGLVFELPVITFFLTRIGIIRPELLSRNRKYAVLVIFIVAAVLTPGPDPVSQCLLAIPVYLLYEVSILVSKMARKKKDEKLEEEDLG